MVFQILVILFLVLIIGLLFLILRTQYTIYLKIQDMATNVELLEAKIDEQTQAIADERAEVSARLGALQGSVDELTAELATAGTTEQIDRLTSKVQSNLDGIKSIYDAPVVVTEPRVTTEPGGDEPADTDTGTDEEEPA